jgi:hypothetical protein
MRTMKTVRTAGAWALLATLAWAGPAAAQWNVTSIGVVEYDTNETLLLLAGLSASPAGPGIRPVIGVQGYRLTYDAGADRTVTLTSIRPSAGVRGPFTGGSWNARVGYAFTSRDETLPPGIVVPEAGAGRGVVVSGGLDFWGTGGPLGWQALASYNLGSESFWGRGRVTTRVAQPAAGGEVRVGAETAINTGPGFTVLQPGGVVSWHTPGGIILGLGAGVKLSDDIDNATYFKAEVVLPLVR